MILNKLDILFICKMQPVSRALVLSKLVLNKPETPPGSVITMNIKKFKIFAH